MIDFKTLQKEIIRNKKEKGFNINDIPLEFSFTHGELSEAFDAYIKKLPNIGEELADVLIYLLSIAETLNINLEEEVLKKIEKNKKRVYKEVNGVKIKETEL